MYSKLEPFRLLKAPLPAKQEDEILDHLAAGRFYAHAAARVLLPHGTAISAKLENKLHEVAEKVLMKAAREGKVKCNCRKCAKKTKGGPCVF